MFMSIEIFERILVFLINILGIFIGFIVWSRDKKDKSNLWFLSMTVFMLLWIDFSYLGFIEKNPNKSCLLYRLNWCSVSLYLLSAYFFYVKYFLDIHKKILERIFLFFALFFALFSLFSNRIIQEVHIKDWGAEIVFGSLNDLFNVYAFFLALVVVYFFIKNYSKTSEIQKKKIIYFLIGTLLITLFNILFNIISPMVLNTARYQHFGDYSAILFYRSYSNIPVHDLNYFAQEKLFRNLSTLMQDLKVSFHCI